MKTILALILIPIVLGCVAVKLHSHACPKCGCQMVPNETREPFQGKRIEFCPKCGHSAEVE